MGSISHHITPLVINSLGGGDTRILSRIEAILRNQTRTWFKNLCFGPLIGDMLLTSNGHSRDILPFLRGKNIFYFVAMVNGPYSLLVRASYFISCFVYARSTSVIFIVCKWRWGCRYFLTSRISMPCSEAIGLIIR